MQDTFTIEPGYFGPVVVGKLGKMRKARRWHVSPVDDGSIMVQGEGCIGQFDFRTRAGVLNTRGGYFIHLARVAGAVPFEFPAEFVAACLEACPALDSETSRGGVTIVNTVRTIGGAA